jgi:tetratricopeptide (TPR) repeat protein
MESTPFYCSESQTLMAGISSEEKNSGSRSTLRVVRRAGPFLILLFLIWSAGSAGLASLVSVYAARSGQINAADTAVRLSPRNAQTHLIRGGLLQAKGNVSAAVDEYARAVSLRPADYILWLNLAHARELTGDKEGAIAAATNAVDLAPRYARPHWQLGNILVRAGRVDEGFSELRVTGASYPSLLPAFIDLAWQLSGGNVQYVVQATKPRAPEAYKALADYFRKRGQTAEAIAMFRAAGDAGGNAFAQERRAYLAELIAAKKYNDAQALWRIAHPPPGDLKPDEPWFFDPGFEQESDLDEPGFGWRSGDKAEYVNLSLDAGEPKSGRLSLQILFSGNSDPGQPVISQLVSVSPRTHYQLRFAARTQEIVSGGLPGVMVIDAGSAQVLAQSGPLPQTSDGWRDYTIDFTTLETSEAIQIKLQRGPCASACPIFGRLWLDSFSLQKLR